ncbi:hypothetical protein [Myxococcus xanthus]|uniref:hypothetical protein n=1 Tax=Myxococcus xanthus TaxID=34 RepID=UPI001129C87E|nr:hypothetical protein [Myxococcus xanthus]QDE84804.1 hypothetical protein BHS07_26415 [Myxococcus xanthus]
MSLVGLLTFQDARSPGLHRLALLSSTFRRHPALPLAAELSNFSPSMTRNPRFLVTINTQAASVLLPLSQHLLQCIAAADVVWADETPLRVLDVKKTRLGYGVAPVKSDGSGMRVSSTELVG